MVITLLRLFITTFTGGFVLHLFATEIQQRSQKTLAKVAGSTLPQSGVISLTCT